MDVIFTFVIPILGFVLAIIGAWDKLVFGIRSFSQKRTDRKLKKLKYDLEQLKSYNENQPLLIAYLFKQTFMVIIVVFFAALVSRFPEGQVADQSVKIALSAILSWAIGFFAGRGIRVANFVINHDKIKQEIETKISQIGLENKPLTSC